MFLKTFWKKQSASLPQIFFLIKKFISAVQRSIYYYTKGFVNYLGFKYLFESREKVTHNFFIISKLAKFFELNYNLTRLYEVIKMVLNISTKRYFVPNMLLFQMVL